jgi:hypothetical protein
MTANLPVVSLQLESEVKAYFAKRRRPMADHRPGCGGFVSLGRYGEVLQSNLTSLSEAEAHTIAYFAEHPSLIRPL